MSAGFLFVPEWQGSPSPRAMRLLEGAAVLRGDLPSSAVREIAVPLEAGDSLGTGVARLGSVLRTREAAREALREERRIMITVGGDASSGLAGLEAASAAHPSGALAVLWLDAQPALETSGPADRAILSAALGAGPAELAPAEPLRPDRVLLAGVRDESAVESQLARDLGLARLEPEPGEAWSGAGSAAAAALRASGARAVYLHLDLDVLDPAAFSAVHSPVPFGLDAESLLTLVGAVTRELPLAGATLSGFAPADEAQAHGDMPTVLRVIGALARAARENPAATGEAPA